MDPCNTVEWHASEVYGSKRMAKRHLPGVYGSKRQARRDMSKVYGSTRLAKVSATDQVKRKCDL